MFSNGFSAEQKRRGEKKNEKKKTQRNNRFSVRSEIGEKTKEKERKRGGKSLEEERRRVVDRTVNIVLPYKDGTSERFARGSGPGGRPRSLKV